MKKTTSILLALLVGLPIAFGGLETEYEAATDGTAAVTFAPNRKGLTEVKSIHVRHDNGGTIKFYAKGGAERVTPSTLPTNLATVIYVSNTAYGLTTNDMVAYYHARRDRQGYLTGLVDYRTISAATTSNVTLNSAITSIGAAGDQVYEFSQQGQIDLSVTDYSIIATGTNYVATDVTITNSVVTTEIEDANVFAAPKDSPLYVIADTTGGASSNLTLQVTADRVGW